MPDPENRVELSPTLADHSGLPAPRLTYRIDDNTHALCAWHIERARESLTEAGAWHTEVEYRYPPNGHFMGTARMGDDPEHSVVNRWSMAHAVPNLGILDGSTFVTSGGVNPTSSICALALRAVDHLLAHRSELSLPARSRSVHIGASAGSLSAAARGQQVPLAPLPSGTPDSVDEKVRNRLGHLADHLIPASGDRPSATEVGVTGTLLDRVLTTVPSIAGVLRATLDPDPDPDPDPDTDPDPDVDTDLDPDPDTDPDNEIDAEIADDPAGWLSRLKVRDRAAYSAVVFAVSGAYYLDPGVRHGLGYEGQIPTPVRATEYPEYVAEDLLEPVLATWSPTPLRASMPPRPGSG